MSVFTRLGKIIISSVNFKDREIKTAWIIILVWVVVIMPFASHVID